jgi:hypothetical protein
MTTKCYNNKVKELNSKFPNLKAEVTTGWNGLLQITVCNFDKAKTLTEMYKDYNFTF